MTKEKRFELNHNNLIISVHTERDRVLFRVNKKIYSHDCILVCDQLVISALESRVKYSQ